MSAPLPADCEFDAALLAELKRSLHQLTKEHVELRAELEQSLCAHKDSLRDYAQRSRSYRTELKQVRREVRLFDYTSKCKSLQETERGLLEEAKALELEMHSPEKVAASWFKIDLLKELLESGSGVDTVELEGSKVAVDCSVNKCLPLLESQPEYAVLVVSAYVNSIKISSIEQAVLFFNACELFSLAFCKEPAIEHWLEMGRLRLSQQADNVIVECDRLSTSAFTQAALDAHASKRLLQRLTDLVTLSGLHEASPWRLLDNRPVGQRAMHVLWHKLTETLWNVAFSFQCIQADAIGDLSSCVSLLLASAKHLGKGPLNHERARSDSDRTMDRLQTLQWVLGMSLMQIMNSYRREKLQLLTLSELLSLVSALFSPSSLREACLQEIEQDLADQQLRLVGDSGSDNNDGRSDEEFYSGIEGSCAPSSAASDEEYGHVDED